MRDSRGGSSRNRDPESRRRGRSLVSRRIERESRRRMHSSLLTTPIRTSFCARSHRSSVFGIAERPIDGVVARRQLASSRSWRGRRPATQSAPRCCSSAGSLPIFRSDSESRNSMTSPGLPTACSRSAAVEGCACRGRGPARMCRDGESSRRLEREVANPCGRAPQATVALR